MYEFDSGLALINIEDAQRLYRLDGVTGVRLKLDDLFAAPEVARDLWQKLPVQAEVRDWTQQPRQLLPRGRDREAGDVHHPHADHRGGRVQHRVGAGHGR